MKNKKLFIPYITAGYPNTNLFIPLLESLSPYSSFIEVGVPHSDPLADGPTIQESSKTAIENGVTLKWILNKVKAISNNTKESIGTKLILFSYFNPIHEYGFKKLLKDIPKDLFYGLIIPDLPLEESERYLNLFKKYKLHFIPLIAPTTKKDKIKKIAKATTGFIYLVSVAGVTGQKKSLSNNLKQKIKEIKSYTNKPIVVGFGIGNQKQASEILNLGADGVVIGSAIISVLKNAKKGTEISKLTEFVSHFS